MEAPSFDKQYVGGYFLSDTSKACVIKAKEALLNAVP